MSDRCTGACCRLFTLPRSPAELAAGAARGRAAAAEGRAREDQLDIALVASMAVLVAAVEIDAAEWWLGHAVDYADDKLAYFYTCKNLLPNGDCGIYAWRPRMCSDFPYGRPCTYGGACAWDAARETGAGQYPALRRRYGESPEVSIARMEERAAWR